ncbi:MAG TPA: serine/threonine-protein kinase, partial [Myxococcota bacterium]|nr:serine/threonine-protein kinase [Myxococcota bacterium]
MGKVFLAKDPKLDRDVAIKVLSSGAKDAEMRERFRLEVKAVAALKHPNIVELYDYSGPDAQDLYFVMEYVPGPSLYDFTAQHGLMGEAVALCVGHELALALMHAHAHSIVHRDLKPENMLLHDGRLVLMDFGIVKAVAEGNVLGVRADSRTRVLGTPGFMAPEQFSGRGVDHRTDIFALGAVLYNLTTGHLPYEGGSVEGIYKNLKSGNCADPREHLESLSPAFCQIIARCIAPKPKDRFPNVGAFKDAVLLALSQHGVTEPRAELRAYQANPGAPVEGHRDRRIDALLEDLRAAFGKEDATEVRRVLSHLESLGAGRQAPPPLPGRQPRP